jgi:HK97 family phage major capsid protein
MTPINPRYATVLSSAVRGLFLENDTCSTTFKRTFDMSIQDLREKRQQLKQSADKLLADNPNSSFNETLRAQFDSLVADIDRIDVQIHNREKELDNSANSYFKPDHTEFKDELTGTAIPVAFSNKGKLSAQISKTLQNKDRGDYSFTDFIRGVAGLKTTTEVRNALSVGTDASGGFTLPSFIQLQMIDALVPNSSLLQAGAGLSLLSQGAKNYRIAAMDTVPTAAWRAESGAIADSDPVFRSVDVTPRSLAFKFKVSRELLSDSANIQPMLMNAISQSFAKELDRVGLRGSGTAPEPRGILNTSGIQSVTNGTDGASLATTGYSNLISSMQEILQADAPLPKATIMSPRSYATLAGLLATDNQPRMRPTVLDTWNYVATSQIPNDLTVGASTDCSEIYVADFSNFIFFMREDMSIQLLNELYAGTGEIGFVCHMRVDTALLYPSAFSVVTGVKA